MLCSCANDYCYGYYWFATGFNYYYWDVAVASQNT